MLSLSEEQTVSGCCLCLKYKRYQGAVPVWRTNGIRVLSLSEEQTISGCCPCLKNKRYQGAVPAWRTNGIRVLSLSEEQMVSALSLSEEQTLSGCCPCLKNKRYRGAVPVWKTDFITVPVWATAVQLLTVPLGTMRVYVCVVAVRKWEAEYYLITILVCTVQNAVCTNGEITFGINGTRSADCTNVSGFFFIPTSSRLFSKCLRE